VFEPRHQLEERARLVDQRGEEVADPRKTLLGLSEVAFGDEADHGVLLAFIWMTNERRRDRHGNAGAGIPVRHACAAF
jgi:hypothetical protein